MKHKDVFSQLLDIFSTGTSKNLIELTLVMNQKLVEEFCLSLLIYFKTGVVTTFDSDWLNLWFKRFVSEVDKDFFLNEHEVRKVNDYELI